MTARTHSPVSLVLLPTLLLLLSACGRGAAKPVDEEKRRQTLMTSELQTAVHFFSKLVKGELKVMAQRSVCSIYKKTFKMQFH